MTSIKREDFEAYKEGIKRLQELKIELESLHAETKYPSEVNSRKINSCTFNSCVPTGSRFPAKEAALNTSEYFFKSLRVTKFSTNASFVGRCKNVLAAS